MTNNPYDILGIPHSANSRQLNEAYRAAIQAAQGNPQRLQQLNDAYDAIVLSHGAADWGRSASNNAADLSDIQRHIATGRYDDAVALLDGIPPHQRRAQWHYLKGCAQRGRGWLEEAEKNFAHATRMEPGNQKYRAAHTQMQGDRRGEHSRSGTDPCAKLCGGLMCLNCLCRCCR